MVIPPAGPADRALRRIATIAARASGRWGLPPWRPLRRPVFVIGCPRSGTTMLAGALAAHARVTRFPGEANDLWHPRSFPWRRSALDKPPLEVDPREFTRRSLAQWTPRDRDVVRRTFAAWQALHPGRVFVQKSAMISFLLEHVLGLFPDARFVHLHRDGRAVALSWCKRLEEVMAEEPEPYRRAGISFRRQDILVACARTWSEHMVGIEEQAQRLRLRERGVLIELSYDDFCGDPARGLEALARFLEIDAGGFPHELAGSVKSEDWKFHAHLGTSDLTAVSEAAAPGMRLRPPPPAAAGDPSGGDRGDARPPS